MLEIVTRGPNAHELRRDGVRVAVVDDIADARKLASVDELIAACKALLEEHGWYHPELPDKGRGSCAACCQARTVIKQAERK
jgi:hypothetical protein